MTVSILGCGWFGKGLAKSLIGQNIQVKGSTTSTEKLAVLSAENINAYLIKITAHENSIIDAGFFLCDVLVVANNVKMNNRETYLEKIKHTISLIVQYNIKKVIFISSTSVYGEPNAVVNETTLPTPETLSGKLLLEAELLFQNNPSFSTSIIRFGGLIGPGRNPADFFAGKTNIPNGLIPVNLIHLDDCVGISEKLIFSNYNNIVVNGVAPYHPSKSDFYTAVTKKEGLQLPQFIMEKNEWKIVESIRLENKLNYQFKVNNWFGY